MGDDEVRTAIGNIQEALDSLVMIQQQGELPSKDAAGLAALLEVVAHNQAATSLSNLAKLTSLTQVQAFSDEYRQILASIWSQPPGQSEASAGWGLFNPKTAAAQRPVIIAKLRNLLCLPLCGSSKKSS
jgi:hypothetical protein